MTKRFFLACTMGLGLACSGAAQTETLATMKFHAPSFRASTQRDTWNTVLLVSAGVAVLGVVNGDSTLTVLGIAGVVVSLVETRQMGFRFTQGGLEFAHSGALSFGFNPFGRTALDHGVTGTRPGPFLQYTVRF